MHQGRSAIKIEANIFGRLTVRRTNFPLRLNKESKVGRRQ